MQIIQLTQGEVAFVDDEDYTLVSSYTWYPRRDSKHNIVYALANIRTEGKRRTIDMHRLILPDAKMVDHINHDGLDNRRKNLRAATPTQNQQNRKPAKRFKGVDYIKSKDRYRARITLDGRCITLGAGYSTEEAAALAYNEAARKLFGEFAYLNVL